ncbi:MAG: hypothetical protein U0998_08435 [Moraxellaceae bacterium]|nr:hypothetical protein [Moraxellaceae bacterium]MDP1776788.1 hypothetical protein [Moraxellaceae bacterium]MDZ4298100.1 hypothetical protein [Moraxellaceae bacterium]MDZ4387220.1 hypothetical protein [Moraxellaceae bacterium]
MEREIKSIAAHKTALISALVIFVLVFILTLIQLAITAIGLRGAGFGVSPPTLQLVMAPFMYFAVIYVLSFVLCKLYNVMAPRVGGIRIRYEDQQP